MILRLHLHLSTPDQRRSALGREKLLGCCEWSKASLGGLHDGAELLSKHHVTRDLQLPSHECLHAIQLPVRHGDKIFVLHRDGYIRLRALAARYRASPVLEVEAQL